MRRVTVGSRCCQRLCPLTVAMQWSTLPLRQVALLSICWLFPLPLTTSAGYLPDQPRRGMFSDVLPMPEVAIFVNVKSSILSVCVLGGEGMNRKL